MAEKKEQKKHLPIIQILALSVLLAGAAVYGGGIWYHQDHFLKGTTVDRIDVSGLTVENLEEQVKDYLLKVTERKADGSSLEEDIKGKEISLAYSSAEPLQEILESQNKFLWFLEQENTHETEGLISYDEDALRDKVKGLSGFQEDFANAPTDAYISDYLPGTGFEIVPETQGNELDFEKTVETVAAAVEGLKERVDLDSEGCYKTPKVSSEDEKLNAALEKLQKYANLSIIYNFGQNQEVLDGNTISGWLHVDGFQVELDQEKVKEYVSSLRKKYDTIFRSRTFQTSYGKEITIEGGDYGWWMNYEQEAVELAQMIKNGESGERTPVYYQTAASYGTPDYGDSYVEINLTAQHLFLYKNGKLVLESDFVSGNSSRGFDTPAGAYSVTYKQRNATLVGENYATPVDYWMPFNGNIGMHDATWRRIFGGNIYKTNGSHGCINLPHDKAQKIYENIDKGTAVICYHLAGTGTPEEPTKEDTPPAEAPQDTGQPVEPPAADTAPPAEVPAADAVQPTETPAADPAPPAETPAAVQPAEVPAADTVQPEAPQAAEGQPQ